jgi:hypothetical protein
LTNTNIYIYIYISIELFICLGQPVAPSVTYGVLTQTRTIECVATATKQIVPDSNCPLASKPSFTPSYTTGTCPTGTYDDGTK